jgi:putative two-component system response regulator
MNVLVVDPSEHPSNEWVAALNRAGYQVVTVRATDEALANLASRTSRLVVVHGTAEDADGPERCRAIREQWPQGSVYIVLAAPLEYSDEDAIALASIADDFIHTPCAPSELVARVRVGERVLGLEARDAAIFAMASLAESRDPETGAHLERTRAYCRALAEDMRQHSRYAASMGPDFVTLIHMASPLHDIGKFGLPDSVVLKPGALNGAELEIMRTHAEIGRRTLDAVLQTFPGVRHLEMARDNAATHHERWDGTGYPNRLSGEQIPLCGRIMALADVYDALTTRRSYKDAFSHELACEMILAETGQHFDPEVVAAFVRCEQDFVEIKARFDSLLEAADEQTGSGTPLDFHDFAGRSGLGVAPLAGAPRG